MSRNRLLRRVAELEARHDPPPLPVCLLARPGADGEPRLTPEDEARRAEANAAGLPVIIYALRVQVPSEPDADPFADAPRMAQERPEPPAAPEAPPEAWPASSASPERDPWAWARPRAEPQEQHWSKPIFYDE